MEKHLIHIKITNAETTVKYISAIRKYNGLSVGEIKKNIDTGYAVTCDWNEDGDLIDELNGITHRYIFRKLIDELIELGAILEIYEEYDGTIEVISLNMLDNMLGRIDEIKQDARRDIERELGLRDWETV